MSALAVDKAKNVFFEKIPDFTQIKMPDQKNFVKFDPSAEEPLKIEPSMKETLRHVVPPQVRKMQAEVKTLLQNMVDQQYNMVNADDTD